MSSHSSVDRAPARCSGGHGFHSWLGLKYFFVPRSCHVDQFTFHISDTVSDRATKTLVLYIERHSTINCAKEYELDVLNTFCATRVIKKVEILVSEPIGAFFTQKYCIVIIISFRNAGFKVGSQ